MKTRPVIYCFFVFYLVLFWNLGPSFHRLDCLGFHGSDAVTCVEQASSCCCHSSSSHVHRQNSGADEASGQSPDGGVVVNDDCSCLVCEFFDDFNPDLQSVDLTEDASPFAPYCCLTEVISFSVVVTATARGPPLA